MLPQTLASTYEQYKRDTATVTTWLATTASTLGYVLPNNDASPVAKADSATATTTTTTTTSGRLKGKARAEAKKKAAQSSVTPPPKDKPAHILRIRDLVPMARLIADNKTCVPFHVKTALDAAIKKRTSFGLWLATTLAQDLNAESHASHEHFLFILKRVQVHLRRSRVPLTSPSSPCPEQSQDIKSSPIALTNRFTGLSISEPSQQFLDAPNVNIPTPAKPSSESSPKRLFKVEETENIQFEAEFAFSLLLEDLNCIRARIRWIWRNVSTSNFDLMQASIATDTAIELARSMIEEVMPLVERYGGVHRMVSFMYVSSCCHSGIEMTYLNENGVRRIVRDKVFDNMTYQIADRTYYNVWELLHGYLIHVKSGAFWDDGRLDTFDPRRNHYELGFKEKEGNNTSLFGTLFSDLSVIVRRCPDFPVRDALLSALEAMDKTREPLFYAAFALQIYFDIAYTMGTSLSDGFHTCMSQMDEIEEDIRTNLAFHEKHNLNSHNDKNEQELRQTLEIIRILKTDHIGEVTRKVKQDLDMALSPADIQGHRLLRRSPLISGLLLFFVRSMHRQQSLNVANRHLSIMFAQHLHHGLSLYHQQQKQQAEKRDGGNRASNEHVDHDCPSHDKKWADMDIVHHALRPESFYPGGIIPKTFEDCFRLFLLQIGASPTICAPNWRQTTKSLNKTRPRPLKPTAPILSFFEERYVGRNKTELITAEVVESIIEQSSSKTVTMSPASWAVSGHRKTRSPSPGLEGEILSDIPDLDEDAPGLITSLVLTMQAETLEYTFPLLRMHRECIKLLQSVRDTCEPVLQSLFGAVHKSESNERNKKKGKNSSIKGSGSTRKRKNKGEVEEKRELHYVMLMIFMTASGSYEDDAPDLRPMELAARAMCKWLREGENGGRTIRDKYLDEKQVRALEGTVAQGWSE